MEHPENIVHTPIHPDESLIIKSTIITVITHAFVPLAFIPFVIFVVPHFVAVFNEMDIELPAYTQLMINMARIFRQNWHLCFLLPFTILVTDGLIYFSLFRYRSRLSARLWALIVFIGEGLFALLCILALWLPLLYLTEALE
jgi:type II secretory pathway component PulF